MRFLGVLALGLIGGCAAGERQATMVDVTPPPNFGGPKLTPAEPPPKQPLYVPPPVATVKPAPAPQPKAPAPPTASASVPRAWVPAVAVNHWKWIVIHHSATPVGGAARFNREHIAKGWDELGYHFVVGNGTDTPNGAIEVGSRWTKQKWGAHCKTPDNKYNEEGIGICLVGNFDQTRPSDAQLQAVAKLVSYLQHTYNIPADHIIGHGEAKATECPGRNLHVATVRRMSAQRLADAGESLPVRTASAAAPGTELLVASRSH